MEGGGGVWGHILLYHPSIDVFTAHTHGVYLHSCVTLLCVDCLQLLMWDMCQEKMKIFTQEVCKNGKEASEVSFLPH